MDAETELRKAAEFFTDALGGLIVQLQVKPDTMVEADFTIFGIPLRMTIEKATIQ